MRSTIYYMSSIQLHHNYLTHLSGTVCGATHHAHLHAMVQQLPESTHDLSMAKVTSLLFI